MTIFYPATMPYTYNCRYSVMCRTATLVLGVLFFVAQCAHARVCSDATSITLLTDVAWSRGTEAATLTSHIQQQFVRVLRVSAPAFTTCASVLQTV